MPRSLHIPGVLLAFVLLTLTPLVAEAHPHATPPPVSLDFTMLEDAIEAQLLIEVALAEDWLGEAWYQPEDPRDAEAVSALTKALLSRFRFTIDDATAELVGTSVVTLASFDMAGEEAGAETLKLVLRAPVGVPAQRMHLVWTDFSGIVWEDKVEFPVMVEADRVADSAILSPEEPIFEWRRRPPEFDWSKPITEVSAPPPEKWSVPVVSFVLGFLMLVFAIGLVPGARHGRGRAIGALTCLLLGALLLPLRLGRIETDPLWGRQSVLPSTAQAEKIFSTLHENIYKAFADPGEDETELEREQRIYRELATSVTPDLIDPLYVEVLESLVLRDENGVVVQVEKVEKVEGTVEFPPEAWAQHYHVDWHWRVLGSITHWGHTHRRVNVYKARYLVKHDGGAWRIASIKVREHRRIDEDAEGQLTLEQIMLQEGDGGLPPADDPEVIEPIVAVEELRAGYGESFTLDVPKLSVNRGETVALIGPSGSGKTTLLNVIAGIHVPTAGRVHVAGHDIFSAAGASLDGERRRIRIAHIGLVFQAFELLEHLSVRENILLPYLVNPALERDIAMDQRLEQITAAMGLARYVRRHPKALSHGERQRVAIARALITEPELLLADEPTGNLDPETGGRILDLLFEAVRSRGASLLMVTHDHSLLDRFDRIIDLMALGAEAA